MKPTEVRATDVEREPVPVVEQIICWLVATVFAWLIYDSVGGAVSLWLSAHDAQVRAAVLAEHDRRTALRPCTALPQPPERK
jgi:hypothetical protein